MWSGPVKVLYALISEQAAKLKEVEEQRAEVDKLKQQGEEVSSLLLLSDIISDRIRLLVTVFIIVSPDDVDFQDKMFEVIQLLGSTDP